MLGDVGQGLLGHTVEDELQARREAPVKATGLDINLEAPALGKAVGVPFKGGHQS